MCVCSLFVSRNADVRVVAAHDGGEDTRENFDVLAAISVGTEGPEATLTIDVLRGAGGVRVEAVSNSSIDIGSWDILDGDTAIEDETSVHAEGDVGRDSGRTDSGSVEGWSRVERSTCDKTELDSTSSRTVGHNLGERDRTVEELTVLGHDSSDVTEPNVLVVVEAEEGSPVVVNGVVREV